jgi:hypothetical protein
MAAQASQGAAACGRLDRLSRMITEQGLNTNQSLNREIRAIARVRAQTATMELQKAQVLLPCEGTI